MFFLAKSAAWLAIGFLIVQPKLFDHPMVEPGAPVGGQIVRGAVEAVGSGVELAKNGTLLNGDVVKFCLDRKGLCTQTTRVIGEMIVGSIASPRLKVPIEKQETAPKSVTDNEETFILIPRLRPDYL